MKVLIDLDALVELAKFKKEEGGWYSCLNEYDSKNPCCQDCEIREVCKIVQNAQVS